MCGSVLQRMLGDRSGREQARHFLEVSCSVLQSVAVCCRDLQCDAVCCIVLQFVVVCCSVYLEIGVVAGKRGKLSFKRVHL